MKKYEYDGKIYCEEDLSCEIDNYGGDLYDLYFLLWKEDKVRESKTFYCPDSDKYYDSEEEFIEAECEHLEVQNG